MIEVFKKIWKFADREQGNIKKSIILGFFNAIFNSFIFGALFVTLNGIVENEKNPQVALMAFVFMLVSIFGKMATSYFAQLQRVHAGYFMVADKRIQIGDKLKVVPMGYFNENSLGDITGISTTVLNDVEQTAPTVMVTTLSGFINTVVFALAILICDWRIGLIVFGGMCLFIYVSVLQEKKFKKDAPMRQKAQAKLVEAILETVQGMSVVKAFNLDTYKNKNVDKAIQESCNKNLAMEKAIMPFGMLLQTITKLLGIVIVIVSIMCYLRGTMPLVTCLMMLVAAFIIFEQLESAGHGLSTLRIAGSSIDNVNKMDDIPVMDESGQHIVPKSFDIAFQDVSFSYDKRPVLQHIQLKIPEKTTTAIIGPSGSGKTTLCNLLVRFWDVESGKVMLGGKDVKDYTLESLLENVSMVFQNVYLFADTIENNIKFGKPSATHEEVVAAAKKACCHPFISQLPQGYQTVIDEGGASLSGGEKQRISIARAMLKDAPVVILDEATANVDPENESELQAAIAKLTANKTIIMIAHRLKTVRHADQIVVMDKGCIVQRGSHEQLIAEKGIYADFIGTRKQVTGWKLGTQS